MNCKYGKTNLIGSCVNNARCIVIVKPITDPMTNPMKLLLNTSTNASLTYMKIISALVRPRLRRIAISLDCSMIFADIDEVRLKKQRNIVNRITMVNIMKITFWLVLMPSW